jgi:hypothetical protein
MQCTHSCRVPLCETIQPMDVIHKHNVSLAGISPPSILTTGYTLRLALHAPVYIFGIPYDRTSTCD